MKYVITGENDIIIHISDTLEYQSNGNPLVDNGQLAIAEYIVKEIYKVENVPEEVEESKYCYTDKQGFYKNPNWKEYFTEEQRISALEDAVNMLLGF